MFPLGGGRESLPAEEMLHALKEIEPRNTAGAEPRPPDVIQMLTWEGEIPCAREAQRGQPGVSGNPSREASRQHLLLKGQQRGV